MTMNQYTADMQGLLQNPPQQAMMYPPPPLPFRAPVVTSFLAPPPPPLIRGSSPFTGFLPPASPSFLASIPVPFSPSPLARQGSNKENEGEAKEGAESQGQGEQLAVAQMQAAFEVIQGNTVTSGDCLIAPFHCPLTSTPPHCMPFFTMPLTAFHCPLSLPPRVQICYYHLPRQQTSATRILQRGTQLW
jgi:hypothetical protein